MKATISPKGQITIPMKLRHKLGIQPGQVLEFDENAPYLKATRFVDVEKMRSVIGIAKDDLDGKSLAEWLDELRGPVDVPNPGMSRKRKSSKI